MRKLEELYVKWQNAEVEYVEACRFKERADKNCNELYRALLKAQRELYWAMKH
jgi:hypothetical protein